MDKPLQSSSTRPAATIRLANYEDAVAIQDTLWHVQDMTETPYPDPDIPYAAQKLMTQATEGLICVATGWDERHIVGVIALGYATWPWKHPEGKDAQYLINEHFYVDPIWRKGGTAKKLLGWAKDLADAKGLHLMIDFSTIDADVHVKDRFARINGFKYTGGKFLRPHSSEPHKGA